MKKLKLTLESLQVEQFIPQDAKATPGTVAGQQLFTTCGPGLCPYACASDETVVTTYPGLC
jgi:hypothetical protein